MVHVRTYTVIGCTSSVCCLTQPISSVCSNASITLSRKEAYPSSLNSLLEYTADPVMALILTPKDPAIEFFLARASAERDLFGCSTFFASDSETDTMRVFVIINKLDGALSTSYEALVYIVHVDFFRIDAKTRYVYFYFYFFFT
jgi:hypothetical protein